MWITISLVVFYLLAPALLIYLTKISNFLNRLGAVVLAYLLGLIVGNIGILPVGGAEFKSLLGARSFIPKNEFLEYVAVSKVTENDGLVNQIATVQDMLFTIIIPLAIPLLLFTLDLKKWLKLAKGALLSMVLAMFSLMIVVFSGFYFFAESIEESNKVAGMLVGVYTGGTPNLAAIGSALQVSPNIFILTHTYDLIVGAVALLFLMTIAQRVFHLFLPRFQVVYKAENKLQLADETADIENFAPLFKRKGLPDLLKAIGVSIIISAIGGGLSLLVAKPNDTIVAILSITTLGLLASLIKPVNKLQNSFQFGMYLIIAFSLVVSSMANLGNMFQIEFLQLFLYIFYVVFGSIAIHVGLARIFKVDADTTIISITALTYSPPFVPAVAGALKNKDVIISGLTIGILGYAFGTYLGIFVGTLLK
ncbi:MAG: hypothetical protein FD181_3434 [Prolixibacteraceae bacterium]|nr:MAG: hypothetical protein FD181_3434 [Prolixibacteraceae bacterium]